VIPSYVSKPAIQVHKKANWFEVSVNDPYTTIGPSHPLSECSSLDLTLKDNECCMQLRNAETGMYNFQDAPSQRCMCVMILKYL
jgi:hypothetical protein